ncbi:MAG: GTPase HflX [Firmicutes bacterium]|nr:GTPase HflX [Bacillota bacterium]
MYDTTKAMDRAVLVGIGHDLEELAGLCETCGLLPVASITQNIKEPDVATYIGKGKVAEVLSLVQKNKANVVVFDVELSGSKVRNLESMLGVPVVDRSKVILDIFANRAQTAEGMLQVELAQLRYNLPRLAGVGGGMAQMKNAVGMRGPGEKKLELDKRTIREQILVLEKKLEKLKSTRETSRKRGDKSGKPRVCLVGYTNAGKSTLLNTIAKADAYAEDKLFATLDPKTSNVFIQSGNGEVGIQILLTDTVGFIERLPHEFIRAFESTLDSVRHADLLLHVVDFSNPNHARQIAAVNDVLVKIGAANIPMILVYNKFDLVPKFDDNVVSIADLKSFVPPAVWVSAKNNVNIDLLKNYIVSILLHGKK